MLAPSRRSRLLFRTTMIGAAAALSLTFGASPALSATYKTCNLSQREEQPTGTTPKPTYNFSLKRQVTTCTTAKRVMKAFHGCRSLASHRCTRKVLVRWSCTGRKTSSASGIFSATYTCTWGTRRVRGTYQQSIPST